MTDSPRDGVSPSEGGTELEVAGGVTAEAATAGRQAVQKRLAAEAKRALDELAAHPPGELPPAWTDQGSDAKGRSRDESLRAVVRTAVAAQVAAALTPPPPPPEPPPPEPPLHADVESWVEHVYAKVFIRPFSQNTRRWCAQWWAHPEAIVRLTALWETWEAARLAEDPHPMADWLWRYLDTLAPLLHAPEGPFASCSADKHVEQTPMRTEPAPAGYWQR